MKFLDPMLDDFDDRYLLERMVNSYSPVWYYEMGKVGHQCGYCGRLNKTTGDAYDPLKHKGTCIWALSKLYLNRQKMLAAKLAAEQEPTP